METPRSQGNLPPLYQLSTPLSLGQGLIAHIALPSFPRLSVIPAQAGTQAISSVGAQFDTPTARPSRFRTAVKRVKPKRAAP